VKKSVATIALLCVSNTVLAPIIRDSRRLAM
jgi:hypothetical protein